MKQRSKEHSDPHKRFFKEIWGRWILPPLNFPEFPVYWKHLEKSLLTLCSSHYSSTTDILVVTALSCNETALLCWQTSSLWMTQVLRRIYGWLVQHCSVSGKLEAASLHFSVLPLCRKRQEHTFPSQDVWFFPYSLRKGLKNSMDEKLQ